MIIFLYLVAKVFKKAERQKSNDENHFIGVRFWSIVNSS